MSENSENTQNNIQNVEERNLNSFIDVGSLFIYISTQFFFTKYCKLILKQLPDLDTEVEDLSLESDFYASDGSAISFLTDSDEESNDFI